MLAAWKFTKIIGRKNWVHDSIINIFKYTFIA